MNNVTEIKVNKKVGIYFDRLKETRGPKDLLQLIVPDPRADEEFNLEALEKGTAVEMEHTNDKEIAKKIAKDHLTEDQDYYVKLAKLGL